MTVGIGMVLTLCKVQALPSLLFEGNKSRSVKDESLAKRNKLNCALVQSKIMNIMKTTLF